MNETLTILFMMGCVFLPMVLNKPERVVEYVYVNTKEVKKQKQQPENPIKKDAITALIALGMKKSDAVDKVNAMLSRKKYKSLEDFIVDAYKK